MAKVVMDVEVKTDSAINNVDELKDSIEDVGKETQNVTSDVSEMGGQLDAVSGGAITKFKGLTGTIKGVSKGFKTLKGAIIASGIGALALIIAGVIQAFKSSEEGQDKFAKLMAIIGSVVGNLTDILSDFGEAVIEVFANPVESIKKFGKSIQDFIMGKVDQLIKGVGLLGSAFGKLFDGDFAGAAEDLGKGVLEINRAINPAVIAAEALYNGVNKTIDATKELIKETIKDAKLAAKISDAKAKADRLERDLIVDRAEANRTRAKLLEQAIDKENFSTAQRIGFLEEAAALEEKITNQEIEAARIRSEAKTLENSLSKSTKEDLIEEEQLKARLIDLETAKLTKQKEVTGQIIALKAEEAAALKAIADQAAAEDKERDDRIAKEKADAAAKAKTAKDQADKEEADAKKAALDLAASQRDNTLNAIISLAGEGSKVGKAAALAQATISGIQGVQSAFTTASASPITAAFPAYPFIQAGIAGAFALKTIKSIVSSKKPSSSSSGGGGGSAPSASQPPSFNVVGMSETNQLAQAIGEDNKKPVKAFVVSGDVSTAQSLDRNIVEGASIG
jgi:hypothetical protein|tara:strand:+ start:226 stop:1923 length:1698 start_codon:yes stop_codon:yes gene_type:complete